MRGYRHGSLETLVHEHSLLDRQLDIAESLSHRSQRCRQPPHAGRVDQQVLVVCGDLWWICESLVYVIPVRCASHQCLYLLVHILDANIELGNGN